MIIPTDGSEAEGKMLVSTASPRTDRICHRLFMLLLPVIWLLAAVVSPVCAAEDPEAGGAAGTRADFSYENAYLTEDVTWKGVVLIRGGLTVAPQATVRIEPGTEVRFARSPILRQAPRMVVMGRVHCSGGADRQIIFRSQATGAASGEWGGLLLLSTEKRNLFEHVRIEGAQTGIDARFSSFGARNLTISGGASGMVVRDSIVDIAGLSVSGCTTGAEISDSEVDLRDGLISGNRAGIVASNSSLVLGSMILRDNTRFGVQADSCRIRFSSCELGGNGTGAVVNGGEGQILLSRFLRNREAALQVTGARLRITRSLLAGNRGGGIRFDGGRSAVWGCSFADNGAFNLAVTGGEQVSAVLNWWGTSEESAIAALVSGPADFFPWLMEKPVIP